MIKLIRVVLPLFLILAFSPAEITCAEQGALLIKAHLEPADIVNSDPTQLFIELQSTQATSNLRLEVTAPPGFQVKTPSVPIPAFQGRYTTSSIILQRSSPDLQIGSRTVLIRVISGDQQSASVIAETSVTFNYISRITIWIYLVLGACGIFIGYALRLLIKILQSVPAPPAAPAAGVGPITKFVQDHYYFVDCSVTLVVGLLSLTVLIKNNHVPDTGLYWYSAMGAGVALGLLTNSELLSKLR